MALDPLNNSNLEQLALKGLMDFHCWDKVVPVPSCIPFLIVLEIGSSSSTLRNTQSS